MIKTFHVAVLIASLLIFPRASAEGDSQDPFAASARENDDWLDLLASPVSPAEVIETFKLKKEAAGSDSPELDLDSLIDQATGSIENIDISGDTGPEQVPIDLLDLETPEFILTPEQIAEKERQQAADDAALLEQLQTSPALQSPEEGLRLAGVVSRVNSDQGAQKIRRVASNYAFFHKQKADRLDQVAEFFDVPASILAYVNGLDAELDKNLEASLMIPGGVFTNIHMPLNAAQGSSLGELEAASSIDAISLLSQPSLASSLVLEANTKMTYPSQKSLLPEQQQALRIIESRSLNEVADSYGITGLDLIKHNNSYEMFIPSRSVIKHSNSKAQLSEELFEGEWLMELSRRIDQTPNEIMLANPSLLELPLQQGSVLLIPPASAYENILALNTFEVYQAVSFNDFMSVLKGDPAVWIEYNPKLLNLTFVKDTQYFREGLWHYDQKENRLFAKVKANEDITRLASLIGLSEADVFMKDDYVYTNLASVFSKLQATKTQSRVYGLVSGTLENEIGLFQAQRLKRDYGSFAPRSAWWLRQHSKDFVRVEVGPFDDLEEAGALCAELHKSDLFCAPIVEMDTHTYTPLDNANKRVALIEFTDKKGNVNHYNLSGNDALDQHELKIESVSNNSATVVWKGDPKKFAVKGLSSDQAALPAEVTGDLEEPVANQIPVRKAAQVLLEQNQKLMDEAESMIEVKAPMEIETAPVAKALSRALLRKNQLQENNIGLLDQSEEVTPEGAPTTTKGSLIDDWDDANYAWQIMVARDVNSLSSVKAILGDMIVQIESKKSGKAVYIALMGSYKSKAEAKSALAQVPASIKILEPWLRRVGHIKKQVGSE